MLIARPLIAGDSKASMQYMADFLYPSSDTMGAIGELPDGTRRSYNRATFQVLRLDHELAEPFIDFRQKAVSTAFIKSDADDQINFYNAAEVEQLQFFLGFLLWPQDNSQDIGQPGSTRPRDVNVARNVTIANNLVLSAFDAAAVTEGAVDSGGAGFRLLRVPN